MKVLVDIWHPAHVHFFKNAIMRLKEEGHDILITARDKDVTLNLLEAYGFEYKKLSKPGKGIIGLFFELFKRDFLLHKIAKNFEPDVLVGVGGVSIAHVGKLIGKPSIVFTDTEHATLSNTITFPFADVVCTPSCFKKDLGKKQVRYNGYHELAYLHPDYFDPNPDVLKELGLDKGDKFFIIRLVSWGAAHDVGHRGMSLEDTRELIKRLEEHGAVFISSEEGLPEGLQKYELATEPKDIHNVLKYATMYLGEGATMATEAAILGTPSIYISSLVGTMGNFIELEQEYELIFNYNDSDMAMNKAVELIQMPDLKEEWDKKRKTLLKDKIDVTKFTSEFIEDYVEGLREMKRSREIS